MRIEGLSLSTFTFDPDPGHLFCCPLISNTLVQQLDGQLKTLCVHPSRPSNVSCVPLKSRGIESEGLQTYHVK